MRRKLLRRGAISIGILVIVAGCAWLAAGAVVGWFVESRLAEAGFPEASAAGVSLAPGGVEVARLRLDPGDDFVLDDVRLSLSTSGISRIEVGRLRLESQADAGGAIEFPGRSPAGDDGPTDVVALVPARGIAVDRAELRAAMPSGDVDVVLSDLAIGHGPDDGATARADFVLEHAAATLAGRATAVVARGGAVEASLTIADGSVAAAGLDAGPLAGDVKARFGGGGPPVATLTLEAADARLAELALGRLALQASLSDGLVELGLRSPSAAVVDLSVAARASVAGGARLDELTADARFRPPASGELKFTLTDVSLGRESGSGRLVLSASGLAYPGLLGDGSIAATARVEGNADRLHFAATEPWTATLVPADDLVPEAMQGLAGQPAAVTLTARDGGPLELAVALSSRSAELSAAMTLDAGSSHASAAADVAADWRTHLSIAASALRLDAEELPWHDATLGLSSFEGQAAYAPAGWRIAGAGALHAEGAVSGTSLAGSSVEWSGLELKGSAPAAGGEPSVTAVVTDGTIELPASGIGLRGIDGTAAFRSGALQSAELTVAAAESLAEPAWWTPMRIEADANSASGTTATRATAAETSTVDAAAAALAFDATITDELGVFVAEVSGRVENENESGAAELMLYPIRFIEGATAIGDISPRLAASFGDATGVFGFEGAVAWGPEGTESSGLLELEDFGATVAGIPVAGVSTSTALSSLWPPATDAPQRAEIARVALGVPLVNGVAVYDLDPDGRLAVQELAFDVAGGRLYAEPFTVDSVAEGDIRLTLAIENLELAQMLELSQIDGLDGTGVLSGSIPVRIADGGVRLDEGRLAAETDGSLRYTPENLPAFLRGDDQRTAMLREVLTNFQYDEMSVAVSGESGEDGRQTVRFDVAGANPDFLDGHPIELAFTFQGPLLGAMSSAVDVAGAAEIEEIFEQQQLNDRQQSNDTESTQ